MKDIMHPDRIHDWARGAVQLLIAMAVHGIRQNAYIERQVDELQRKLREQERRNGPEETPP